MSIGDYIYYRRFDNPADSMTLYRFPKEQLEKYGFKEGEVPHMKVQDDLTKPPEDQEAFPEETVFSLADLK